MREISFYIFVVALVLIALAYYTGLKTDAAAASSAVNSLIQTATGRDSKGAFAAYPGGA